MEIQRTLDDASPMILYGGNWVTSADPDPLSPGDRQEYYRNTLHRTYGAGATIKFTFQGNAVYFVGTTGPNNGNYTVKYDNEQVEMFTGYSENRRSRQMLYNRGNTGPGVHQVIITNLPIDAPSGSGNLTRLDLDMIQLVSIDVGDITTKVLDNTDATIRYSDGWRQEVANNKQYSNGSAHNSGTAGSTVLIPFSGTSIAVYGSLDAVQGAFQATIDGQQDSQVYDLYRADYMADVPFYTIGELENKDHTLMLTNTQIGVRSRLTFDHAVVNYTTPVSGATPNFQPGVAPGDGNSGASSGTGNSGNKGAASGGSNAAVIGGAVGGALGGILLAALLWFFCCRRRNSKDSQQRNRADGSAASGAGLMGMVGLGKHTPEPQPELVRPYETELEKADSASHISHLAPGHGPSYNDNRRPSSHGSSSAGPRRMSIDSPPHLATQLQTPRTFTDATLTNTFQPAILDDVPHQKSALGIFGQQHQYPGREGSVSDASLYSQNGQTMPSGQTLQTLLNAQGLSQAERDTLLQAILANPAILNGSNSNLPPGGSFFAPSIAASSGVFPAYGTGTGTGTAGSRQTPMPGMSVAPSSNAVPSPIQTRHAPGFGRPTSRDGTSVSGISSLGGEAGPLPFVLDIGGAAARVRAQHAHGNPPQGVPHSVSGRDDGASTAFPQSVGGSVIGDPTPFPFPQSLRGKDQTIMTPPQSSTTAYTGLGPNTPESASKGLMSGWNSNEKGLPLGGGSASGSGGGTAGPGALVGMGSRSGSPLKTAPVSRPAVPTLNIPQEGEGEGGQQFTPGYVRDHKIPIAMGDNQGAQPQSQGGSRPTSGSGYSASGGTEVTSGAGAPTVGQGASGYNDSNNQSNANANDNLSPVSAGSRPQSRLSMAFGSRDAGVGEGEVPPDYAQVLAESQHGSPHTSRSRLERELRIIGR